MCVEKPKVCAEPPKVCLAKDTQDTSSQDSANKAVGRDSSKTAPTEKQRSARPEGTQKAGDLVRENQSTVQRDMVGTSTATAVAANSVATKIETSMAKSTANAKLDKVFDQKFQQNAYSQAKTVAKNHSNTASQLKVMRRKMRGLENFVANGGGVEAQKRLVAAKTEYQAAHKAWVANKPLAAEANAFVKNNPQLKNGGLVTSSTKGAQRFKALLNNSAMGRKVVGGFKVLTNPRVTKGLAILGGSLDAMSAYKNSTNRTTEGKVLNGGLAGLGNIAVTANPVGAVADLVLPEGYRPSDITRGGATALSAMAEGVVTGDERAAADFHERSKRGDFGAVMKQASESGDYWAEKGIAGGLSEFGSELKDWVKGWF